MITFTHSGKWLGLELSIAIVVHIVAMNWSEAQHPPLDPTKTVGIESCAECHEEMVDRWSESAHATSFETLIKSEAARNIAEIAGIQVSEIPTTASCVRCHYTREFLHSAVQTTESISCESCHGPALDWINLHNVKSKSRAERVSSASEAGMKHPQRLYEVVKTCFECHVVDDEQLVNHTGHPAITNGFELLSWYEGETSHNYLVSKPGRSVKSHSSQLQPIPIDRRRMLFLTGKLMHLSYTLKVISRATDPPVDPSGEFIKLKNGLPTFAVQHSIQARRIFDELVAINKIIDAPEIKASIEIYQSLSFVTGQKKNILEAGEKIDLQTRAFTENHNGSEFHGIDSILETLVPRYSGLEKDEIEKVSQFMSKLKP
ncbi:MAG: cytochrome c family protein [Verrucomicrobiales bacterium]|nr:cytochrome c family protein [Verrucomicrobiales bacterium]